MYGQTVASGAASHAEGFYAREEPPKTSPPAHETAAGPSPAGCVGTPKSG
jgi:hypothetical protein